MDSAAHLNARAPLVAEVTLEGPPLLRDLVDVRYRLAEHFVCKLCFRDPSRACHVRPAPIVGLRHVDGRTGRQANRQAGEQEPGAQAGAKKTKQ